MLLLLMKEQEEEEEEDETREEKQVAKGKVQKTGKRESKQQLQALISSRFLTNPVFLAALSLPLHNHFSIAPRIQMKKRLHWLTANLIC